MQTTKVVLLAIGDELLNGQVIDTNTNYLAKEMAERGYEVIFSRLLRDRQSEIVNALREIGTLADLVLITGGLGPTTDDLTRQAIAEFADVGLEEDALSRERLENNAKARGLNLVATSLRQAQFPIGSQLLINPVGTADGFWLRVQVDQTSGHKLMLACFPGVHTEMKAMFSQCLKPVLDTRFGTKARHQERLICVGLRESTIGSLVEESHLPTSVAVAYRAHFPEVRVTLSSDSIRDAEKVLEESKQKIISAIGSEFILEPEEESLAESTAKAFMRHQKTLALAESCTGGMLASSLVSIPGASKFFLGSFVTYSNQAKIKTFRIPPIAMDRYGAVSKEIGLAMARGAREELGADIGFSITGIAGPDGGRDEKPVGLVWFSLSTKDEEQSLSKVFKFATQESGTELREKIRRYCVFWSLSLLRRHLCGYTLEWNDTHRE